MTKSRFQTSKNLIKMVGDKSFASVGNVVRTYVEIHFYYMKFDFYLILILGR